ncbi:outer membrane protein assembly factor BamC [Candidatus Parabeggiatoa sp. HSG14]|uniref:outer membrane protein assembly factor BamC n=1 Tax=Candidatus Parabeggiatoa sp. HSG14 TaxID=3055593 RepID=UPI0025A76E7D|nr:outer membrane protein assembly factor BamC [Thiotrichales bacterium HSG14]
MPRLSKMIGWCLLISVMGGCSTLPDHSADYKKSTTVPPLEIPPDLIGSTHVEEQLVVPESPSQETTTFSDYNFDQAGEKQQVQRDVGILPYSEQIQIKRDGSIRWLVLQEKPDVLWTKVKQFWQKNGFILKTDNPSFGIMETQWAENRADIPQEGIRHLLGKILDAAYSASTRDKFRVRLERGKVAGTTELYLTHKGAEEVAKDDNFVWQGRPSDPELEAEMLNRLIVYLFEINEKQAETLLATHEDEKNKDEKPVSRAQLTHSENGHANLIVRENFAQTWRRTGLALDRIGFTVEDRDRDRGLYFIRYIDPEPDKDKGFWGRLFGSSKPTNQEYLISLIDEQQTTRIVVKNNKEQIETRKTAAKILTLLHEQLK